MTNLVSGGLAASLHAKPQPFPAIVLGGLIVGVHDLTYAILVYSPQKPILIPQTLASRKLAFLVHHAVTFGLIYGALVYLFMHLVVLPLSAVPHRDMPLIYKACEFVEHWFCVGLPIALSVRHYSR